MARRRSRDRISQLPADILDHILGFLPIQDAAKTAALSSIWRDVWLSLTQLNFDDGFFCYIYRKHRHAIKYGKKLAVSLYVINKVLLLHKGTIRKFVLNIYNVGIHAIRSRSYDFDQWLLLVTRKGVEEIYISFEKEAYRLPSCVFSCSTLKRLHLYGVAVEPMNFPCRLPNVASLCFQWVDFGPINCAIDVPVLENLSFLSCENIFYFNIAAPKLCSLTIESCSSNGLGKFLPDNLYLRSISTLDLVGSVKLRSVATECMDTLSEFHVAAQTNKMLHALKLISLRGSHSEKLFIKKLLASFSTLEMVVIVRDKNYCKKYTTGIMQELLDLHVASTKTKIIID